MPEDITEIQIDLLNLLRKSQRPVPVPVLAEIMQIPPSRINRIIKELSNWGYELDRNAKGELRLAGSPDILFPHEISNGLKTKCLGQNIFSFDRVNSTNLTAYKYAERGEVEGTLVVAERQTAGKGRLGRSWSSPPKVGIYISLILRPLIPPVQAPGLSLIAAVSVAETTRQLTDLEAMIKWPNDVLIAGRKTAGVLTELTAEIDRVKFVIMGIGINVNQSDADFPAELAGKATSLKQQCGEKVDRVLFIQRLLLNLEKRYRGFIASGLTDQIDDIREYSAILGKSIRFKHNNATVTGIACDIDANGMLIVELGQNKIKVSSGEITLEENY
jgi:BirA family biotin operon repressor/biotin-[acetyl-CoA-carboxylase] ligase